MPLDQVLAEVTVALDKAATVNDACQRVCDALTKHTPAMAAVLLHVRDHLRCVAATGSWQMYSSVPLGSGVVGRVFASGRPDVVTDVNHDEDYVPLGPQVSLEICVPVPGPDGRPVGVFNVEWPGAPKPNTTRTTNGNVTTNGTERGGGATNDRAEGSGNGEAAHGPDQGISGGAAWPPLIEEIGRRIGVRVSALGGPPTESNSEKLLRHALAFGTAEDEAELLTRSLVAARDVTGLRTPAVLLPGRSGIRVHLDREHPTELGRRLAALDPATLARLAARARRHGASYSLGSPPGSPSPGSPLDLPSPGSPSAGSSDGRTVREFEALTAIGVGTIMTVPVGPGRVAGGGLPTAEGVMLLLDERVLRLDPAMINLLELLAAHAWISLDRLATLRELAEKASSDPLTGLRHYGPFGERLSLTVPDRTALLAIDVDRFKQLNDTYGHAAGDRALIDLARALQAALRTGDELYRVGGDEFAAVIEIRQPQEAVSIAERLVGAARRLGHTVSVGVAVQRRDESAEDTLHRADQALYDAKRTGRDRVRLADAQANLTDAA